MISANPLAPSRRLAYSPQPFHPGRDAGPDPAKGAIAENAVAGWRQAGRLPFQRLSPEEIKSLQDTRDSPANASPDAGSDAASVIALDNAGPLSAPDTYRDNEAGRAQHDRKPGKAD